jgi:amidase
MSDSNERQFWKWDAVDLAVGIRKREFSCREVVTSCLERLTSVNPKINAVVVSLEESALREADAADSAVARGDSVGIMHGIPVTIKCNVDQIGQATSNGVVAYRDIIASEDSPVVANFKAAGAIIIGRTNTPAFSASWFTGNDLYGRTYNPWSEAHTPGGSSGGASSCVAAGIVPVAHGNDLAGSVRYPAYCTGLVGLRPSFGRVPAYLPTAKVERALSGQLMSVQGPIARRVRDVRLALAAMSREDSRDPWWVPAPLVGPPVAKPIRIAMAVRPGEHAVHPTVADAVSHAGAILSASGYEVEEVELPDFNEVAAEWAQMADPEAPFYATPSINQAADERFKKMHGWVMEQAYKPDLHAYMQSLARRTTWIRKWTLFLKDHPIVLLPVSFEPPFLEEWNGRDAETTLHTRKVQLPSFAVPVLGFPAISVPTGVVDGIPTGVQLVASRFREDLILDAAEAIERSCPMPTPIDPRF